MTRKNADAVSFPVRGIPGGWKDAFDEDDRAIIRHQAELVERDEARCRELAAQPRPTGRPRGEARPPVPPTPAAIDPRSAP